MRTIHVGTYQHSGGPGLVPVTVAPDGRLTAAEAIPDIANASFAVRGGGLIYAVDEQEAGGLSIVAPNGAPWRVKARVATGGDAPCYVAIDETERRLAVANYESGTVALFTLQSDGLPRGVPAIFQNHGCSVNPERQSGPHAHCVRFHDGALYAVDLGADQVLRFDVAGGGFGEPEVVWTAPAGHGPRHLLFHPELPLALLLCELSASLTLLVVTPHGLTTLQTLATTPPGFAGENLGGHLAFNESGDRVYVSNRGHNSLAAFSLEDRRLAQIGLVESGGEHPRHFALLPSAELLIAAHEKDGCVGSFRIARDGQLTPTGHMITVPGACFVLD